MTIYNDLAPSFLGERQMMIPEADGQKWAETGNIKTRDSSLELANSSPTPRSS